MTLRIARSVIEPCPCPWFGGGRANMPDDADIDTINKDPAPFKVSIAPVEAPHIRMPACSGC